MEILYSIFDQLSVQTIVLSIGNTCRHLRVVVQSYDRYEIDLRQVSYSNLKRIRRLIAPEKVQSLTVSESMGAQYQSIFNVKELTCVRTLTLAGIRESALRDIMKLVNIPALISLSIDIGEASKHSEPAATYLTSILIRANLQKLALKIPVERFEYIKLFRPNSIQHLELAGCLPFQQIHRILSYMPHLETFIIDSCSMKITTQDKLIPFQSMKFFTMKKLNMKVNHLELLLQLMPSLTRLKLIGDGNFFDGYRWQQFIRTKLLSLEKFEFFFTLQQADPNFISVMEQTVETFQTPYWLEMKRWFVKCDCTIGSQRSVQLYSIPLCTLIHPEPFSQTKISMSTIATKLETNALIQVCSDRIYFSLSKLINNDTEQNVMLNLLQQTTGDPIFHNIKMLFIDFQGASSENGISIVSKFVDLTRIHHIVLYRLVAGSKNSNMMLGTQNLLQQARNASNLTILNKCSNKESLLTNEEICLLTPAHVQHLKLFYVELIDVINILERFEHLSTAECSFVTVPDWNPIHQWIKTKEKAAIEIRGSCLNVRFKGDSNTEANEIKDNDAKRMKLSDDRHH